MSLMDELDRLAGKVAHRIRAIVVERTVPVRTGELRRSIHATRTAKGVWMVGTNKVYARAVHDGRPRVVIKPRKKKALYWKGAKHPVKKVVQPPRRGNPFMRKAIDMFLSNLDREMESIIGDFPEKVAKQITKGISIRRL